MERPLAATKDRHFDHETARNYANVGRRRINRDEGMEGIGRGSRKAAKAQRRKEDGEIGISAPRWMKSPRLATILGHSSTEEDKDPLASMDGMERINERSDERCCPTAGSTRFVYLELRNSEKGRSVGGAASSRPPSRFLPAFPDFLFSRFNNSGRAEMKKLQQSQAEECPAQHLHALCRAFSS